MSLTLSTEIGRESTMKLDFLKMLQELCRACLIANKDNCSHSWAMNLDNSRENQEDCLRSPDNNTGNFLNRGGEPQEAVMHLQRETATRVDIEVTDLFYLSCHDISTFNLYIIEE